MQSESLDAADSSGRILRVEFVWRGDRYAHVISVAHDSGKIEPLLESLEGTPADDWPPSPPLQNLHRETLPNGRPALLLVGAAGRSHWSASIEAVPDEPALAFDVACRHSGAAGWLGSRYRARAAAEAALTIETGNSSWAWKDAVLEITPQACPTLTARWKFTIRLQP